MTDRFYTFSSVSLLDETLLQNDIFLLLINANKIPPHIILSVHGKIFAIDINGPTINAEVSGLIRYIKLKRIPVLFVRLKVPEIFNKSSLWQVINSCVLKYRKVGEGEYTCLTPIKEFCVNIYDKNAADLDLVYELIAVLKKNDFVLGTYHLNMEYLLDKDTFDMNRYSLSDVRTEINRRLETITV